MQGFVGGTARQKEKETTELQQFDHFCFCGGHSFFFFLETLCEQTFALMSCFVFYHDQTSKGRTSIWISDDISIFVYRHWYTSQVLFVDGNDDGSLAIT